MTVQPFLLASVQQWQWVNHFWRLSEEDHFNFRKSNCCGMTLNPLSCWSCWADSHYVFEKMCFRHHSLGAFPLKLRLCITEKTFICKTLVSSFHISHRLPSFLHFLFLFFPHLHQHLHKKRLLNKVPATIMCVFVSCSVRIDGVMRTMNTEKLIKTLPIIQNQLDALLDFQVLCVCAACARVYIYTCTSYVMRTVTFDWQSEDILDGPLKSKGLSVVKDLVSG